MPLSLGITLPNAFLHVRAPEVHLAATIAAHAHQLSIPHKTHSAGRLQIMPAAKTAGLGIVTIKAFARGALLNGRDLRGADAGLPRDMLAFVLQQELVDTCICGVISEAELREDLSASWTRLTPAANRRLESLAGTACPGYRWLEEGWRYA